MNDLEVFDYECSGQFSMFDYMMPQFKIDNKIRFIELFAGYGSHSMALDVIGADYEHYKVVEFDKYAVQSYNAVHGTNFEPTDIRNVHGKDLEICDTDQYTYMLTYSFPCTDLSVAGKMQGMKKGSGTRSGLLWEVERILTEIHESGEELPQLLFMENVPQVISSANINDFHAWQDFLTSLGYTSHVQTLNAKDYGVAQNRERTFMFSFLGEYNYKFPTPIPLTKTMKDYLEDEVDEKYYINSEKANKLINDVFKNQYMNPRANYLPKENETSYPLNSQDFVRTGFQDISYTLSARDYKDPKCVCVGNVNPSNNGMNGNVYSGDLSPTLTTNKGEGQKIIEVGKLNSSQDGIVVDSSGISATLTSVHGNTPKTIVAMRGRNPDNPSDRTTGSPTEQRLEPNSQGLCNTITSVQKDNMVLENRFYEQAIKVFQNNDCEEGDTIDAFNEKVNKTGVSPTITTRPEGLKTAILPVVKIKQATKDGYIECKLGGVADLSYPNSETRRGRVQENGEVSPTITATETGICRIESLYRIRKLTPRECGRLMAVSDRNIDKILSVVSNSQAYKQFGNSIVVNCMIAMFSNLNIQNNPRWSEIKDRY